MKIFPRILVLAALLTGGQVGNAADVLTPCFLKLSLFQDIPGITVDDLFDAANFPDDPDEVRYLTSFDTRDALPDNTLDNYGARIEGFITPLESGDYHFFLRSDDGAELYLSSDDTEANAQIIAEELDCCDAFQDPDTDDFATSLPITLEANSRYFIMVLYKEGTGGDFAQVAWRKSDDATPAGSLLPISGAYLSTLASDSDGHAVSIIQEPANATGIENDSVTFELALELSPDSPVCVQWQKNGINIPGAQGNPVTLGPIALADNGAKISAVVAVPGGFVQSAEANLTVTADTTAPELLSVNGVPSQPQVVLSFSERMDQASASRASNYLITSDGAPLEVQEAQLSPDGTLVTLVTADQVVGTEYSISFTNLTDRAATANSLPSGTTGTFFALGKLLQGEDGFVIWEAEMFDRNLDDRWAPVRTRPGASGDLAMEIPNGAGGSETDTQLEYDIVFTKTGTHVIWYRAGADSGNDDSAWLHLDGDRPANRLDGNLASMSGFNGDVWEWNSNPQDGAQPMTFEIEEPGVHTIGIARREDGAFFDKLIITTDLNFDPTIFGDFGPPVTRREGEPAGDAIEITITEQPSDTEGLENTQASIAAEFDVPAGSLTVLQWQRKSGAEFVDIPGASFATLDVEPLTADWDQAVLRLQITVGSTTVTSEEATLTVIPETEPPLLLRANGIAPTRRVTLSFSEPLDPTSATDPSHYVISGPNGDVAINDVLLLPNGLTVLLETGAQQVGTKYTVTVDGVTDTAASANALSNGIARYYSLGTLLPQSAEGLLVFEAESFTANLDDRWVEDSERGTPSGGVSMLIPNGAGGNENETKLEYDLEFTQTGTHIIWYRASSPSGSDDSAWLHVDGERPPSRTEGNQASMSGFSTQDDFIWVSNPQDGPGPMTFEIDSPGGHTIGIARREDGAFFDKLVITTDPDFDPTAFGPSGPPETREGAPALPSIELTGPANEVVLTSGASVALSVRVDAQSREIAKLVYYANDLPIAELTEAPFDIEWSDVPDGIYSIRAELTDDVGISVGTRRHSVAIGTPNEALFVVGNPDLDAAPGDQAVANHLGELGFTVTTVDDNLAQSSQAFGRKVVIISSTVVSGTVSTTFRDTNVPVLLWEQANQDDFGLTADEENVTRGGTDPDQTDLEIVLSDHPLSAGLPLGGVTVSDMPTGFNWGQPNENAIIAATINGQADRAALYGYETGDELFDGFFAPARRVMVFLNEQSFTTLTENGRRLFNGALSWAIEEALTPQPAPSGITIQISGLSDEQLGLAWDGGGSSVTVQTKTSLAQDAWSDVITTNESTVSIPLDGPSGFFRVVPSASGPTPRP